MLKRIFNKAVLAAVFLAAGANASAQSGEYLSYSPYTIYGVGDLAVQGTPYTRSMGGVGIASRNVRYINTLNPAAVTARDTLSVMMDFSLTNSNVIYSQLSGGNKQISARNITNIGSMAMSFPVWRNLAMMIGATPYSGGGYTFTSKETNPVVIANNGNINYYHYGQGALYKLYGAAGYSFWKKLSVGAEADYVFGNFSKSFTESFVKTGYNAGKDVYDMKMSTFTGKFGLQYEQKFGTRVKMGLGATYQLASEFRGTVDYSHLAAGSSDNLAISSSRDTLGKGNAGAGLADELGVGLSLNIDDKLRAEVNYTRSDWTRSRFDTAPGFSDADSKLPFVSNVRQSIRGGVEYTPDRYNIRYYTRRISYRAGAYWNNEYYKVAGNEINSFGITLGATLPIPNQYNLYQGLSVALDFGQRGTVTNTLVRERYVKLCIGVNLHDIWFRKMRYE
jgi:hypothetical protein